MSGRQELIEKELLALDGIAFQKICDAYLVLDRGEFSSFSRTGSQLGKKSTVKGIPDTYFRLRDGSLWFVEYTTVAKGSKLTAKNKKSIEDCIDLAKTGVPQDEICGVILCCNSKLEPHEELEIHQYAQARNLKVIIVQLDFLAIAICYQYPVLAKNNLGISIDTGQLLPLDVFVHQYNYKAGNLATPLDNEFLHRALELEEILSALEGSDVVILSGFAGVGKTKIGLEAVSTFVSTHQSYFAYAVSFKGSEIGDDLRIMLQQKKDYILLVDDANRQSENFNQILAIFREERKGKIKIVITVRDYALEDVKDECINYDPHIITLKKFSEKEIVAIIGSDSFEIRNVEFQDRIVAISDGNVRLAIMAARLAKEEPEVVLVGDISNLYDTYFSSFSKNLGIFSNTELRKVLGIVSFFYSINLKDEVNLEAILFCFGLNRREFEVGLKELERIELIEIQFNHARISEQVMGTYFFYKVFIKDRDLSFRILLFAFFPKFRKRFSDTLIPCYNSFAFDEILSSIGRTLDEYVS